MFNLGKKKDEDPKEAIDYASKKINKGLTGGLTKAFMGQDFVDQTNAALDMASQALDTTGAMAALAENGVAAAAEVVSIQDTGQMVNFNPVVVLTLNVTPEGGQAFQTMGQLTVSKLAIPRVGDTINIKYNPDEISQFMIV